MKKLFKILLIVLLIIVILVAALAILLFVMSKGRTLQKITGRIRLPLVQLKKSTTILESIQLKRKLMMRPGMKEMPPTTILWYGTLKKKGSTLWLLW